MQDLKGNQKQVKVKIVIKSSLFKFIEILYKSFSNILKSNIITLVNAYL